MAFYYSNKFYSNGTSSVAPTIFQSAMPAPTTPGEILAYDVTVTAPGAAAPLTTADTVYLARKPPGARVLWIEFYVPDWDTGGTALAVNIGTTAVAAQYAAGIVIGTGTGGTYRTGINGATTGPAAAFTTADISTAENILLVPTANATTGSVGVGYFRIYYTALPPEFDPTNSPNVVTS